MYVPLQDLQRYVLLRLALSDELLVDFMERWMTDGKGWLRGEVGSVIGLAWKCGGLAQRSHGTSRCQESGGLGLYR